MFPYNDFFLTGALRYLENSELFCVVSVLVLCSSAYREAAVISKVGSCCLSGVGDGRCLLAVSMLGGRTVGS